MRLMGTLIVNLQSLEFALRGFLYNCEIGWANKSGADFLGNIEEGQQLEENAFTNYDTLAKLIEKYNSSIRSRDPSLEVDSNIVRIRDALAHGRIASDSPDPSEPNKLVKYDRPKDGYVRVTDCCTLTKEWFDQNIHLVCEDIRRIAKANELGWACGICSR
jgi:hypothetical protein